MSRPLPKAKPLSASQGGTAGAALPPSSSSRDKHLIHYEPRIDFLGWEKREARYKKKLEAGKRYILKELFGCNRQSATA